MSGIGGSSLGLLLRSIWQSVCAVLAGFHLRPLYIGAAILVVLSISLVTALVNSFRGRTKFTLEPQPGQGRSRGGT